MRFEYRLVYAGQQSEKLVEEMNAMGKMGWRLVDKVTSGGSTVHLVFEREIGAYRA